MKVTRIYVDTSVVGGCCDPEFEKWSYGLLSDFKIGIYTLLLSELVDAEIKDAPEEVKDIYVKFRKLADEVVELSTEAVELADAYIFHNILSHNFRNDAMHIAIATVKDADLVVSWNFKHIVHFEKVQMFNGVNIEMGYKPIQIYSPREVTKYGSKIS